MATIIFDIDDTLYDQMIPFKNAFQETIGKVSIKEINDLYRFNREKSDELFEESESGELPKIEMQVMRIRYACEQANRPISREAALAFQNAYEKEQQKIVLYPEMKELLNKLAQNNHKLALLTNGPAAHQQKKIDQLGLSKWIDDDHMFISGQIGSVKPDKEAFEYVESFLTIKKEKPIFIGDSFQNDMVGGKKAGWRVIWLNTRRNSMKNELIKPDKIIEHPAELIPLFEKRGYIKN